MKLSFSLASLLLVATLQGSCWASTTTTMVIPTPSPTSTPATTSQNRTSEEEKLSTSITTIAEEEMVTKKTSVAAAKSSSPTKDDVLEEVGRLLGEMREVAASMQEAREEHGRLAHAVAQISAAVRDMGEHNLHIKKKVRKMSKSLNRSSHHHKVKDGLKLLQRDHQRILEAMNMRGGIINLTRLHNHTHNHNRNNNQTNKHNNNNGGSHKNHHNHNHHEVPVEVTTSGTSPPPGEGEEGTSKGAETTVAEAEVTDNLIPDLVVEPPGATDPPPLPQDCTEVMQRGNWTSGAYMIQPRGINPIKVWCDHTTNGGGWTVALARMEQTPQENFDRNWAEYKAGFGDPAGEHFVGTEALHAMTESKNSELRVNITDWNDNAAWAEWKEFSVAEESKNYRLKVGRYTSSSQAGDALKWHNGMKFSTPDRDNDALLGGHCAKKNHGGWWYRGHRGCYQAHPVGRFQHNPSLPPPVDANSRNFDLGAVLVWQNWRGESYYPKTLFLMFRPIIK